MRLRALLAGAFVMLACLLLPASAHAGSKQSYGFWCGLRVADVASTEYALARGAVEGNPLLKNRAVRIGTSAATCVVMSEVDKKLSKKERKIMRIVGGVLLSAVVVSNARGGLK
jgi:hypothetical protein